MQYQKLHLKEFFPWLAEDGRDPAAAVYLPDNLPEMGRADRRRPCVVICPGGGYHFCSQREAEPIAVQFLLEGYCVFVLNYSPAPHRFPCQLQEVAALLELIGRHADEWHCDGQHIAILGFSAGGHLAAHYCNAFDHPAVRAAVPESRGVQAAILCYPVITTRPDKRHTGSFVNLTGHEVLTPEDLESLSCERLVTKRTPPTFLWHTAQDQGVPVENSLLYASALSEHRIPFEMHIYPWGCHGLATCTEMTNDNLTPEVSRNSVWMEQARRWLNLTFDWKG